MKYKTLNIKGLLPLLFGLFVSSALAQTPLPISNSAYFQGFEIDTQEGIDENGEWQFAYEELSQNRWAIGDAVSRTGTHSLYISPDGGQTAGHGISSGGFVSAYRDFVLEAGRRYRISFDWINPSANGRLYVCWINLASSAWPQDLSGEGGTGKPAVVQLFGIDHEQGMWPDIFDMPMQDNVWQNKSFTVAGRGLVMRLAFVWISSGVSGSSGVVNAAIIDNVQISYITDCVLAGATANITDFRYEKNPDGSGTFRWSSAFFSPTYDLIYKDRDGNEIDRVYGLTQPWHTVNPSLPNGIYTAWVRMTCMGDTTAWYIFNNVFAFHQVGCIDFLDLRGSTVTTEVGNFSMDTGNIYWDPVPTLVDFGYASIQSRHTVHFDRNEFDYMVPYLRTIPNYLEHGIDAFASVRLGNWDTGAQAERITYRYVVPEGLGLLLLHWAAVLENMGHPPERQPLFMIEVLNSNMELIEPACGGATFIANDSANLLDGGWQVYQRLNADGRPQGQPIDWRDWTTFGFNLHQHVQPGDVVYIRLTTRDCSPRGHWGYAYFVLECFMATLEGMACAGNPDVTVGLTAPPGFTYAWFYENDPFNILSTERIFVPQTDRTYTCRMGLMGQPHCFFELSASAFPREVIPAFDYEIEWESCTPTVRLINTSHTLSVPTDTLVERRKGDVERSQWSFETGVILENQADTLLWVDFGGAGTYRVWITAGILEDCDSTTFGYVTIPPFGDIIRTDTVYICEGERFYPDPEWQHNLYFDETGVYLVFDLKHPITGCDSIRWLDLYVHEVTRPEFTDSLFLYRDDFYDFFGRQLTDEGTYSHTILTPCGECPDTIITLHLRVFPAMEVEQVEGLVTEICDDQSSFMLMRYRILAGNVTSFSVLFNEEAREEGFNNIDSEPVNAVGNIVSIEIPVPPGVAPNIYSAILILEDKYSGNHVDTIPFMIRYSSAMIRQKWHDVLMLRDIYNQRFQFSTFQWYKNDDPIEGATRSYVHIPEGLDVEAEYRVRIVRTGEANEIFTCPIIPEERIIFSLHPTIVSRGDVITTNMPTSGHAVISNVMGIRVSEHILHPGTNQIHIHQPQGTYFVMITNEAGDQRTYTILVK